MLTVSSSALGHPLGCTGARQAVTVLSELRRQNKRVAVTSMCVGTVSYTLSLDSNQIAYANFLPGNGYGWYLGL